jgi:S-adenosylmethionine:tRNA ribosyltransferase-isomerase
MGHLDHHLPLPSLNAGVDPLRPLGSTRLLAVHDGELLDRHIGDLVHLLRPGDLLVLNDSATLPASLVGELASSGAFVEVRLAHHLSATDGDGPFASRFAAVLFGEGSWRDDTDERPAPPVVRPGDRLLLGTRGGGARPGLRRSQPRRAGQLVATVEHVSDRSDRLVHLRFDRSGDALAQALFREGTPVQYRHLPSPLTLEHVQTPFARLPWSMEMPSTGRPLAWSTLDALEAAGVHHVFLTHAAGLSATGDPALDAALPLPEVYDVPQATLETIEVTRRQGGRIIAVGTTVVRALEAVAHRGGRAGKGVATLRIDETHVLDVVDGILTGVHSPGESHFELLHAFASHEALLKAHAEAARLGYRTHELGDLMLIL